MLVQRPGPGMSQEAVRRYGELTKLLRQQHEVRPHQWPCPCPLYCPGLPLTLHFSPLQMCLNHSTQFTHLGNIAETIK